MTSACLIRVEIGPQGLQIACGLPMELDLAGIGVQSELVSESAAERRSVGMIFHRWKAALDELLATRRRFRVARTAHRL